MLGNEPVIRTLLVIVSETETKRVVHNLRAIDAKTWVEKKAFTKPFSTEDIGINGFISIKHGSKPAKRCTSP
jgi:hypothetical protein